VLSFGWKYNMDNIKASMLIPQLTKANKQRLYRKKICELYREHLSDCPQVTYPYVFPESEDNKSDYHLFTIWVDQRDDLLEHLQSKGIGVAVNYRSINLLTALALANEITYRNGSFPNSEQIGDSTLTLPLHCSITNEDVIYICNTIKEFFKQN